MSLRPKKIFLVGGIIAVVAAFFVLDLQSYASLSAIKSHRDAMIAFYQDRQALVLMLFALAYITVTAFSLPLATPMTLFGGAVFGLGTGLVVISFSSTIGATLAFLMARFLLRETIERKFSGPLRQIYAGFEKEGAFYLFALRLVPAFPFFLVNVVTGLMPLRTWTFYWVSQLGMFPATMVFVYAGTQLGQIEALSDVTSAPVLMAFAALGSAPLALKKILNWMRKERQYDKI